ncbi:hypothetical protein OAS86_01550 [Gammaproteobacteria bacterium]|nr:hypothetical protein [Gammaproteobacteria bacterium]
MLELCSHFGYVSLAIVGLLATSPAHAELSVADKAAFERWTTQTAPYLHSDPLYRAVQFSNLQEKQVFSNMLYAAFVGKMSPRDFYEQASRRHPAFVYSIEKISGRLAQN